MRNLSNKTLAIISLVFLGLSGLLIYYGYMNVSKVNSVQKVYKDENKKLKEKIGLTDSNTKKKELEIEKLNKNLKEMAKLNKNYEEVDNSFDVDSILEQYKSYYLETMNPNYDLDRLNSMSDKSNRYRKLISVYFGNDEVNSLEDSKINIILNSFMLNDIINTSINEKIIENNNRINKRIGAFEYFKNNKNYLFKYEILKNIKAAKSKDEKLYNPLEQYDFASNMLYLKEKSLSLFDNFLFPSQNNSIYLTSLSNEIITEKNNSQYKENFSKYKSTLSIYKDLINSNVFSIDIISQNIDYLKNYNILDKTFETNKGVEVLRYLIDDRSRIYMVEQRLNGKPQRLSYYSANGNVFFSRQLQKLENFYFDLDKNESEYKEAMNIKNKF